MALYYCVADCCSRALKPYRLSAASYGQTRHQYYLFTDIKNIVSHTSGQNVLNLKVNLYDTIISKKKSHTNYTF